MSASDFARLLTPVCVAALLHRGVAIEAIRAADFAQMRCAGIEPGSRLHESIIDAARQCGPDFHARALESFPCDTPDVPRR